MHTNNQHNNAYNYTVTLAGDPLFDGEQKARRCGYACIERDGSAMGLVDLCGLPDDFLLHHQHIETIDDSGVRRIARLCVEDGYVKFNSNTLKLQPL